MISLGDSVAEEASTLYINTFSFLSMQVPTYLFL